MCWRSPALRWSRWLRNVALNLADLEWIIAPPPPRPGRRTDLARGPTTMAMVVAAAIFLRWTPHHGWFVGTLVAAAGVTALAINVTRKPGVRRAVRGIYQESMPPDLTSTAAVTAGVVILGIYTVLLLPFEP
ncbi:hypothetical protein QFZ30_001657 [Arthrobacter pascens]|uniref:hypothetical protein n=1 Tax=Arthrobacter pascens TaxID=1677 RepID=UPI002793C1A9|nr:hypothetical protein [Arthrobacter pascens]MDQ0678275.1 hypothetical protein [Arthrobacter pascens]